MIDSLEKNEIFVFGSNKSGHHAGGAAKQAYESFGAEWGVGSGRTGQCYAIDTMSGIFELTSNLEDFLIYAKRHPELTFLLTKIGCGIAGYEEREIKELLDIAVHRVNHFSGEVPGNVIKPEDW
jgi:hypothetical protein